MKWYQIKEQAAGEKRLMFLWYLYKFTGKKVVKFITVFVVFVAYIFSSEIKKYTKQNLEVIYKYTNNVSAKPTWTNCFKLVLNYAWSLVDKMEAFSNNYPVSNLNFESSEQKALMEKDIENENGIIFICSHIGNIEVLRTFVQQPQWQRNPHVNIFLSENQCKVFNNFLKKIQIKTQITTYPVEKIGIETAIDIEEKLNNGEVVFIAGDRISLNSSNNVQMDFLGNKIDFPSGCFQFAQLMNASVYFISAIKDKQDTYKIYMEKFEKITNFKKTENIKLMQTKYRDFLEKIVTIAPLQFYHFYELFRTKKFNNKIVTRICPKKIRDIK